MNKVIVSKRFVLQARDFIKGIPMAILTPVLFVVQQSFDAGQLELNYRAIAAAALGGFFAYLIKQFFTKPKVITTYDNNNQAVEVAQNIEQNV